LGGGMDELEEEEKMKGTGTTQKNNFNKPFLLRFFGFI
jgi:hypothetical protein